jgi:preprotein translocase subunit SecY
MDDITAAYARELQMAMAGIEIKTPEHPEDRAQRHRIERMAVLMIAAISAFAALVIAGSLFRPVPEKRIDWSTGILQLVLGGAVGFALKRSP